MTCADIVSSIGLVLDIVGVVLVFKYGLQTDVRETGGTSVAYRGGKSDAEAKREYRHYSRLSRIGLGCLIVGFVLQLVSNFLS